MSATGVSALFDALDLLKAPAILPAVRAARFADDITLLLRVLAMDAATLKQAVVHTGASAAVLCEAAEFFVLQVCFTPGIDSYRILAANREDPVTRIREHYRLLVRWLHPDRNSDVWQTVFLDRVNRAWRDLRRVEERAEYDRSGPAQRDASDPSPWVAGMPASAVGRAAGTPMGKRVSARAMQRLPSLVLGGLGTFAALFLLLMYLVQDDDARTRTLSLEDADRTSAPVPMGGALLRSDAVGESTRWAPEATATLVTPPPATAARNTSASDSKAHAPATARLQHPEPPAAAPVAMPGPARRQPIQVASAAAARSVKVREAKVIAAAELTVEPALPSLALPSVAIPSVAIPNDSAAASSVAARRADPPATQSFLDAATTVNDTPSRGKADEVLVDQLLQQFRNAYVEGDLIKLMALFTREARNRAEGSKRLADDYRTLFQSSQARRLSLHDRSWWREGDMVAVVATFDAAITPNGGARSRRIGGDIRFELRREGDAVRIARIRHQAE